MAGGEKVLPANTCPLIKASVGARLDGTCPFFKIADMYIGETTCDGKKKAWEILQQEVPVHVMDIPQMKREKDILAWKEEIRLLLKRIEEFTGNKVTPEILAEKIKMINNKRKALARLYNTRKSTSSISGKDALLVTQIAFYDDRCEMQNKSTSSVIVRSKNRKGKVFLKAPALSLQNTHGYSQLETAYIIETSGAAVVVEELCITHVILKTWLMKAAKLRRAKSIGRTLHENQLCLLYP